MMSRINKCRNHTHYLGGAAQGGGEGFIVLHIPGSHAVGMAGWMGGEAHGGSKFENTFGVSMWHIVAISPKFFHVPVSFMCYMCL